MNEANESKIGLVGNGLKIEPVDFFVPSSYIDGKGEARPCYLITKKGCDMVANKLTGEKGILFTAAYVTAFEEMRERLTKPHLPPEVSPGGLAKLISVTRRVILDAGGTPQDVCQMVQGVFQTWNIPVPKALAKQIPGQMYMPEVINDGWQTAPPSAQQPRGRPSA